VIAAVLEDAVQEPQNQNFCIHRSELPTEKVLCKKCKEEVTYLDVFTCARFGKCTEFRRIEDMGCCRGCELAEYKS
jgi:hypothetical protein